MIDFSNIIEVLLGVDDVLKIEDSNNVTLWQKVIYYNVSISAGNNGSVSVNGVPGDYSQSVPAGTVLTIEGTGATGYDFDTWSDGNTDNPRTITVTGDLTLTASFAQAVTANYFYVEDISGNANTLSIKKSNSSTPTIEPYYSTDGINWTSMGNTSTTAITATVPANGKLYLKCTTNRWASGSADLNKITCSSNFNVGGNIMSLLNGDNFNNTQLDTNYTYHFSGLFYQSTTLVNASNLELPNNVANCSYFYTFAKCPALTTAPTLPATTMANRCYYGMFWQATSLTTAPALPATTLDIHCYNSMFSGCTALTSVPASLPATTLAEECYRSMFRDCSALTTAPALPATTLAPNCYGYMFQNCTSLTTAPALPATTLAQNCYQYMFDGCTSLTSAPTLSATNLAYNCYGWMFSNCTSLTTAPALPATTLAESCYQLMFYNCTALTSAPTLSATMMVQGCYKSMFMGCSLIDRIDVYADDNTATDCTYYWLYNVAASGDFYNYSDTATYTIDDPSGVPVGWTLHNMAAQPNDEIWYETNNGQIADFSNAGFNATILSNTYTNGKGVVKFNSNVTSSSGNNSTSRATNLTKISFPDSFTSVGQHTFDGCPLTELDLNNITTIGYEAFDFNHIQHLHIPATCTNFLRGNPFRSTYITQITVDPNNPTFTDGSAHNGGNCVYNGTTIAVACKNTVIPDNCTSFGEWSFSCIPALTTLDIPSTVTSLQGWAVDFDTTMVSNPSLSAVYARTTPSFGTNTFDRQKTGGTLYYTSGVNYSRWLSNLPNYWTAVLLCDVTISAGNNGSISVNGVSGNYHQPEIPSGTQLTLVATPAAGYQFDSWSDGDTNATRTITVTGNTTLTASFILPSYNVSISAGNNGSISVDGVSGNYTASVPSGTQLHLVATPDAGCVFEKWSDNARVNPRNIIITSNTTLTASFTEYFYIEDVSGSANTLSISALNHDGIPTNYAPTIEVFSSTDGTNWSSMGTTSSTPITATIPANSKLYLKAIANQWCDWESGVGYSHNTIICSGNHNIGGNIMSLLNGDNFANTDIGGNIINYTLQFSSLFESDAQLVDASALKLPNSVPEQCYYRMFEGCTALTTAPALPGTYTNQRCYDRMFYGCTSLTTAPTLIATTLSNSCYQSMFYNCTSLNKVITYADTFDSTSVSTWLYNVSPTGDFFNLGAAQYESGYSGIPSGWTEHTSL